MLIEPWSTRGPMKKQLISIALLLTVAGAAQAALIASDIADNYGGGGEPTFATGQDGGSGFGAWTLTPSGSGGSYLGASGLAGASTFGLYSGSPTAGLDELVAGRPFDAALNPGDTFSIDLGYTGVASGGGEVGLSLFSGANYRMNLKFQGGSANWVLNFNGSDTTTSIPWAGGSPGATLSFAFTRGIGNLFDLNITQGASNFIASGLDAGGSTDISRVELYSKEQGNNENLGFNNLAINAVPEPAAGALMGLGLMVFAALRRR